MIGETLHRGGLLLFLLLSLAVAAVLRIDFYFTIVYLLIILYVFSRLWVRLASKALQVTRTFADHAFWGDHVPVRLQVSNTGWLPIPWLVLHESLPVQLTAGSSYHRVFPMGPRGEKDFEYTLACSRRGYYEVGPLVLETGDLLGLARPRRVRLSARHIVVYPQIVPLQTLGLPTFSPLAVLPARAPLFEDPTRIMGVRDYQVGDSPRRMHWTATAATGRLLVKRYQPSIARETLICLDLDRDGYGERQRYTASELAIVVAASLAHHMAVQERQPVGLTTHALDPLVEHAVRFFLPPRSGRGYLMQILEVLARAEMVEETPLPELLRHGTADLSWGTTIVVITGRETSRLFEQLVHLRRSGFAVSLILVQPGLPATDLNRQAAMAQVPIRQIWERQELGGWS